ncbi:MAG: ATP-binding protein [Nitrospirota bacterium]|jgi:light-regulated signal transduction histidine kinase (bacteriophytochrome)
MAVIYALRPVSLSSLTETLLDSSLLITLLSPILYFFVFRPMLLNITEREQAEESLRRLNQELQNKTSELALAYKGMESFSYSVSHDLRAPLRILVGLSDIVIEDYYDKLDDKGKKLLHSIRGEAARMDKLVQALLHLSRVGRQEMKVDEIDMEKQAGLIAADLKALAPERNIEVTIEQLPPIRGDITLIRQVFTNLLSNAVKFTGAKDLALITVGGLSGDGENVYYVKDNGVGFDMAHADKLFGVFRRMHSEKEFEGIGIGLSIVERIVKRHGGRVWAEGRPYEGATFYFSLPRR